MTTAPTLERFRELAKNRRVIPVVRRLFADGETAVGLYQKLAGERPGTFLLESAEHGRTWSRYSFIGVRCPAFLTERDGQVRWSGELPVGLPATGNPIEVLRSVLAQLHTPDVNLGVAGELPPLTGGVVGYMSYDLVRRFEQVPDANPDEVGIAELGLLLATDLAVLDHSDGSVILIANAVNYDNTNLRVDQAWADAVSRLDQMQNALATDSAPTAAEVDWSAAPEYRRRTTSVQYQTAVAVAKERIRAGDIFQVVPSQRFSADCSATALELYRVLRALNPSPYMYLIRVPDAKGGVDFDIVGSSPEALVRLEQGHAMVHPIAGTRPRGKTPEEDAQLAEDLLADAKERAEHLMLVDLGRNDLGRVCAPGSVEVVDFMTIERYSHVMHIVSTVTGRLAPDCNAVDLFAATFPAGTLTGAPKPMAMAIVDELEPVRRGVYGGAVGYFDFAGNMDTAIAIRTAVLKDGVAHVQAGAGIVADSNPVAEDAECVAKATAGLRAVAVANSLRPIQSNAGT